MSLSNDRAKPNKFMSGKVLMTDGIRSMKLTDLEGAGHDPGWNPTVEKEYMDRVRRKAADRAREVLRSAKRESEHLREQARREGYQTGIEQSRHELELHMENLSEALAKAIGTFEQSGRAIWLSHRQDLAALVVMAVERVVGLELDERRIEALTSLLDGAVEQLESRVGLCVTVHPGDAEIVEELMQRARTRHEDLRAWRVRTNPAMEPGGLVVESDNGMVDATMEVRRAAVAQVLDMLTVGEGDPVPNEGLHRTPEQMATAHEYEQQAAPGEPVCREPGCFPTPPSEVAPGPAPEHAETVQEWEESAPDFDEFEEEQVLAVSVESGQTAEGAPESESATLDDIAALAGDVAPEQAEQAPDPHAPAPVAGPAGWEAANLEFTEPVGQQIPADDAGEIDPFEAAQAAMAQGAADAGGAADAVEDDPFAAAQAAIAEQSAQQEAGAEPAPESAPESADKPDPFEAAQAAMAARDSSPEPEPEPEAAQKDASQAEAVDAFEAAMDVMEGQSDAPAKADDTDTPETPETD